MHNGHLRCLATRRWAPAGSFRKFSAGASYLPLRKVVQELASAPQPSWSCSDGGERVAAILAIIATCIAHDVNPRAYLHVVTKLLVKGWPQKELLPDRVVVNHSELSVGHRPLALSP